VLMLFGLLSWHDGAMTSVNNEISCLWEREARDDTKST
jgi:hypothetical protein